VSEGDPVFAAFVAAGLWPGLGRVLGEALAGAGIARPEDVTAPALERLPKVGAVRANRLLSGWIGASHVYEVVGLLVPGGLPARLAGRAVDVLGEGAARLLREDPWRLLEVADLRVVEVDRFAVATIPGVRRDDPRRGRALVGFVLSRAARDGHTVQPEELVLAGLSAEGVAEPGAALEAAVSLGTVISAGDAERAIALTRYATAEATIAQAIARLAKTAEPIDVPTGGIVGDDPMQALDATQRAAVEAALRHGVSVLTGGPGTGKSRTVAAVVTLAEAASREIALAAPTGRAAKRLAELTGAEAMTIHRLLGAQGGRNEDGTPRAPGFARGEDWPLDADVVVVDETSMLDAELAAALLAACADGTHLLLVGDPAQLPSIGAGRVLADLIDAGTVPVTELTTLYRQAEGGAIARLATAVRAGSLPPVDSPEREVVVVPAQGSGEAAHRTVQLVTDSIPRALGIPAADVQVVTPVHRGPAGTVELNKALKAKLNPGSGRGVSGFDPGDRVVATANHMEAEPVGFANGEVGVVTGTADGAVTVEFAAGPATVTGRALADLRHGWAITVHRAQGSEWPAVVSVVPPEAAGMLSRPLVYTALTRAQRHLSIVPAAGPALARSVRDIGARPRRTRLRELLAENG
jgi:exodeoxyribonuclease V alpha subunit